MMDREIVDLFFEQCRETDNEDIEHKNSGETEF